MAKATVPVPAEFLSIFRRLVIACQPRHIDRDTAAVYYSFLSRFSPAILDQAVTALIDTGTPFFPTAPEWVKAAKVAKAEAWLQDRRTNSCQHCGTRGLVFIEYQDGTPFDVAICRCRFAEVYRRFAQASDDGGETVVRESLNLSDDHRVGFLEDFEDEQ